MHEIQPAVFHSSLTVTVHSLYTISELCWVILHPILSLESVWLVKCCHRKVAVCLSEWSALTIIIHQKMCLQNKTLWWDISHFLLFSSADPLWFCRRVMEHKKHQTSLSCWIKSCRWTTLLCPAAVWKSTWTGHCRKPDCYNYYRPIHKLLFRWILTK